MEIPSWSVYVAGETLLLFLGVILFLVFTLIRSEHRWTEKLIKANQKIHLLKKIETRYQQIKENLHRYIKMVEDLKNQLAKAQNDPALRSKVSELEQVISDNKQQIMELQKRSADAESARDQTNNQALEKLQSKIITLEEKNQKLQAAIEFPSDPNLQKRQVIEFENDTSLSKSNAGNGEDLWADADDNQDGIDLWDNTPGKPTANSLENAVDKNKKELERLRASNEDQRGLIHDLRLQLASELGSQADQLDNEALDKLERMLSESETIVQMLEDELNTMHDQASSYEARLQQAEAAQSAAGSPAAGNDEEMLQVLSQMESANQMAMTMMQANGDQSNVINFARNGINQHTLEDLAGAILNTVKGYDIHGAIQVRAKGSTINISTDTSLSPAHIARLSDMSNSERYEENGNELLIRFKKLSLLMTTMPEGDPDLSARYRDTLAIVCELACITMNNIEASDAMEQQQSVLRKVISTTHQTIKHVEQQFADQAKQSEEIVASMSAILDSEAFVNAMDPVYRDIYSNIMKETKQRFDQLHKEGSSVDQSFLKVIENLQSKLI